MSARGSSPQRGEQVGEERLEDGEALGRDRAGEPLEVGLAAVLAARSRAGFGGSPSCALGDRVEALLDLLTSSRRRQRPRAAVLAEDPGGELREVGVRRCERRRPRPSPRSIIRSTHQAVSASSSISASPAVSPNCQFSRPR